MAHFTNNIINAYYTNGERDTVCVMWSDGKVAREHYLMVDEEDDQFKELLSEWSYDSLDESTKIYVENARNEFKDAFERYAKERNLYGYTEDGGSPEDKEKEEVILLNIEDLIFNFDPEDTQQKEELFKLKLKFFDRYEVKSSKKRKAKTDLRKAESPLEAIVLYNSFVK
jgi:hypothetical protein